MSKADGMVQLQGLGRFKGTPVSALKVGDILVWNYGCTSEVRGIEPVGTGERFVWLIERSHLSHGTVYDGRRRVSPSRLVVVKRPTA